MLPQNGHNDRTDDVEGEGGVNSSLGCRLALATRPTVILTLCKAGANRGGRKAQTKSTRAPTLIDRRTKLRGAGCSSVNVEVPGTGCSTPHVECLQHFIASCRQYAVGVSPTTP